MPVPAIQGKPASPRRPAPRATAVVADKHPPLTPQMVGFRLLRLTNLLARPFFGRVAKQHALTLNEWRTMVVLAAQPGSAAQDVSAATGLHPMNISRALASLRRDGRVEQARDPGNHRRSLLRLTPEGQKTFRQIAPSAETQAERLLDALSSTELAALGRMVDKLIARAELIVAEAE